VWNQYVDAHRISILLGRLLSGIDSKDLQQFRTEDEVPWTYQECDVAIMLTEYTDSRSSVRKHIHSSIIKEQPSHYLASRDSTSDMAIIHVI